MVAFKTLNEKQCINYHFKDNNVSTPVIIVLNKNDYNNNLFGNFKKIISSRFKTLKNYDYKILLECENSLNIYLDNTLCEKIVSNKIAIVEIAGVDITFIAIITNNK